MSYHVMLLYYTVVLPYCVIASGGCVLELLHALAQHGVLDEDAVVGELEHAEELSHVGTWRHVDERVEQHNKR